jgi:hypothetical protein
VVTHVAGEVRGRERVDQMDPEEGDPVEQALPPQPRGGLGQCKAENEECFYLI